jgi:hypothetical protein
MIEFIHIFRTLVSFKEKEKPILKSFQKIDTTQF